ncbi:hypothetical protein [Brevibacterium linens]|uniref:Uncharacterized protein n=1 Tax=Brevibacterium linens ATCC 9172 TaxID=1255617 RepID=A0A2H1INS8_BRELN|nr:hypothetical protein [Brevibacterium linens]KAB1946770.1 hypothetical protein F8227_11400 [Brevibacterium linens ATCC 9172]SMX76811.1 hypothetical protein BLIN9172_01300 [Brevibacterium linens ATCC 9172]
MTVGNSGTNEQHEHNDETHLPEHSQTLPLITEEIVSSHPAPATEPTEHVVTKVMPPNPIRHDGGATQQQTQTAASPTAVDEAAETVEDKKAEEKSSEGRISATQLLAGAGAAATSSIIGGQLGVAGTVVGAGVASIVTALAVTLYGRSLDKGKEKIQEVGSKLAPAVKAKIAKHPSGKNTAVDPSLVEDSAFAPPEPTAGNANVMAASAPDEGKSEAGDGDGSETESGARTWWQKLRRKRVLYPLTIGVAAFGIGLGAVVVAENFTEADISPGTSQISRSVTGQSTNDESVTDDGTSDSGTGGDESSSGSGSGTDGGQGPANSGSSTQNGQSTSAGETGTEGATEGQSSQGSETTTGTSDSTGDSTTTDGTDASSGSTSTDGTGSTGDTSGGTSGSTGSGSSSDGSGSGSSGSGGSGTGVSGGGPAASAEG